MSDRTCSDLLTYVMTVPELMCMLFVLWKEAALMHVPLSIKDNEGWKLHDMHSALIDTG